MLRIGLDIGSTTLKCVVVDETDKIIYKSYERHLSQISEKTAALLKEAEVKFPGQKKSLCISGSAGMGFAADNGIQFIQEVYSTRIAVKKLTPDADAVIELGGEDAKILFITGMPEVRMNGSCAGGTGAFIDQISTLLGITPTEMNELAKESEKKCNIASRCGVFAKSDIQPLLNQGAKKSDISAGVFAAVVNQTIAGLSQGRPITGKVVYLGGPLTFFPYLRAEFDLALNTNGVCPENSLYFVAYGAALSSDKEPVDLISASEKMEKFSSKRKFKGSGALFASPEEYDEFIKRHDPPFSLSSLCADNKAYIGVDAGSTTVKCVVINSDEHAVYTEYLSNSGNPVPLVKSFIENIYKKFPGIKIVSSASTGYGEDIVKSAFDLDHGIVETVAHFYAARKYDPEVDFIIDIGGQDIKCFKIHNGGIENIYLNEACSSGCGSFLQTFAANLGYTPEEFAKLGIFAKAPVDLGSRCTVFMNSSVKQAQKDGASIADISAGLSMSVVKNALYKVIRVVDIDSLGDHIVVQGGTFLNNSVLRAFEKEIGKNVTRPALSGLMGAYGAALYAKSLSDDSTVSGIISEEGLKTFIHKATSINCGGCSNRCRLTVNTFSVNGKEKKEKYIGGNRCEKPLKGKTHKSGLNMYTYKRSQLEKYKSFKGKRETVGLPMVLNMFELLPFWHTFFKTMGFGVELSPPSSKELYLEGQHTIPSDTVCYPAKLVHGHIERLLKSEADAIFYPCLTYNIEEGLGDNHYNCPVVAYYPEVIAANVEMAGKRFIYDYLGIHRPGDLAKNLYEVLSREFGGVTRSEVKNAVEKAYAEYKAYLADVRKTGKEYIRQALEKDLPVIILSSRPYHLDSEINHGVDTLIENMGAAVISEDAVSDSVERFKTSVLNQWTYHARMYAAAKFVADMDKPKVNLVQLVSFGCGVDAITTDEIRRILEQKGKIYTQIKIDEITNLGAVRIRLRSLFAAAEEKETEKSGGK